MRKRGQHTPDLKASPPAATGLTRRDLTPDKRPSTGQEKEAPSTIWDQQIPELPPTERKAVDSLFARHKARRPSPKLKLKDRDGNVEVGYTHSHQGAGALLLMQALGTTDFEFCDGLLGQLINAGTQGEEIDERGPNFMLSVVQAIQPRDEIEAMLASQMAAVQMATMTFARRLAHVKNIQQQDSAERAFNRLARTFATQMEALKRYRTGGEQKVTVQHVNVNDGGQAIVGNVAGGGVGAEKADQPHEPKS